MESWREFVLAEGRGKYRQETRDLNRALMDQAKQATMVTGADTTLRDYMASAPGTKGEDTLKWAYRANVDWVEAPDSVKALGVGEIGFEFRKADGELLDHMRKHGRAVDSGGDYRRSGGDPLTGHGKGGLAYPSYRDPTIAKIQISQTPGDPARIRTVIYFDPDLIKTPRGLIPHLNDIYSELSKNSYHEIFHHFQAIGKSPHQEPYIPRPGDDPVPPGADPDKISWVESDPRIYPERSKSTRYLLAKHEVESHVRGFYKQSQKSKGKYTFEQLVDQRLDLWTEAGWLSDSERAQVKEVWMDHAKRYLPCARMLGGGFIWPKGCQKAKKLNKEFLEHEKVKGKVTLKQKLLVGTLGFLVLWYLLEDIAAAAETHGPPNTENIGTYVGIFAYHGISIVDPTGLFEIIVGLYDVLTAEDPARAARIMGAGMGEMFGILPTTTTATSWKWPWEDITRASQIPHSKHPIGGPADPRYTGGQNLPGAGPLAGRDCWTNKPVPGFPKCPDWKSAVKQPLRESKRIKITIKRK